MPEKSIREMSKIERRYYSLEARVFNAVINGSIIMGIVSLIIGLGLFTYSQASRYINTAHNLSRSAEAIIDKVADPSALAEEVMGRYASRKSADPESDSYQADFSDIEEREDYETIRSVLHDFLESSDVYDVYLAMYDRENSALVYIVDPIDDDPATPGWWEAVEPREVSDFLDKVDSGNTLFSISNTEAYGWLGTAGVPVRNAEGEVVAFFLTDVTLGTVVMSVRFFALTYAIAMAVVVNLFAVLLVFKMKKSVVKPINDIAAAAESYVADKRAGKSVNDHFAMLNISTGDEIENLALIMADMEREMGEYEDNLTAVTAEKERIGTELSLATRIQADMLPNIFPAFPEKPEFDIYASMAPAKEVGGDFYDFFLVDDKHLCVTIADVSGKGVPAALFMMMSKIMLQNYGMTGLGPAEVLKRVNAQICKNNREEMFVTVWLGILDLDTGVLTAANAGHEYPMLKKPGGEFELIKDRHGLVIGGVDGAKYKEYTLTLEPGAKLFVYTDGVAEATNAENQLFGTDRTLRALNAASGGSPKDVIESVDRAVAEFVGEAPQFDDLTMVCLEYNGRFDGKEFTIEAKIENLPAVTDFVNAELESFDCPMKAQMQLDIAIDELFSNIAHYAYNPEIGAATVRVEVNKEPLSVTVTFIDNGTPYDPLAKADPDVTLSAEERDVGGLGIFLVKKSMDDVSYEYKNGKNILKIKKNMV
ncbi:MAG: SpoIIE family protein phosphatase [Oscillospiraceae bacterium]|nr:SpoIIE family protein phosphatase [Oscillospiraceae bacterium]